MAAKRYARRRKQNQNSLIWVGLGVVLVIVALLYVQAKAGGSSSTQEEAASSGASVVPMAVNFPAPALALDSVDGRKAALADYQGQVVLVNNWATWCPPCKAEMPTLQAYYETHSPDGFMIVAVEAGEPLDQVAEFVRTQGLTFQVWLDPNSASLAAFRNDALPNSFVIDRSGTVRYAWTGPISREMLEKYVTPLLTE